MRLVIGENCVFIPRMKCSLPQNRSVYLLQKAETHPCRFCKNRFFFFFVVVCFGLFVCLFFVVVFFFHNENLNLWGTLKIVSLVVLGFIILTWLCQSFLVHRVSSIHFKKLWTPILHVFIWIQRKFISCARYLFYIQDFTFFLKTHPCFLFFPKTFLYQYYMLKDQISQFSRSTSDGEKGG